MCHARLCRAWPFNYCAPYGGRITVSVTKVPNAPPSWYSRLVAAARGPQPNAEANVEKRFLTISEQVELLAARGLHCDAQTPRILLREGYYAVVNGYKRPFLDQGATRAAKEDRYLKGTSFSDVYALFRFDRGLRALTFRHLMLVEATLRSLISYAFCERHSRPEAYLDESSYTCRRDYLRGEDAFEGDLRWMIDTLAHHARTRDRDPRGDRRDVRVAHFQDKHDTVPLWVLVDELTFGNLKYLFALLRREEQLAVCDNLAELSSCRSADHAVTARAGEKRAAPSQRPLTPRRVARDLEAIVDVRNVCAHGERLYDGRFGLEDEADFAAFVSMMSHFLEPGDLAHLQGGIESLVAEYSRACPVIARELERTGIAGV